ncbi:MAG: TlpA family protein disulfide reductase [Thermoanaerobaculia bacterium]|nr:TlpA family protein disulfide reductase [Thermoanaerobaculia bacterium]
MRNGLRELRAAPALVVLILLAGCGGKPIRNLGCEGPPAVEEGLRAAEGLRDRCFLDEACWERGLAEARALRDRFPEELAAHRAYVLSRFRGPRGEYGVSGQAVAEEYRHRLERQPDDAGLLYLNALLTENRIERRDLLRQSIARADAFPWSRYALALEYGWNPDVEDRAVARAEGARFVAACSDRLGEIQRLAGALDDAALFDRYRDRFVEGFEPVRERFSELATLWHQMFQFAKPDRHPEIRAEVAAAVARTAALERGTDRAWLRALEVGYRMTGDSAGSSRVEELVLAAFPCETQAMSIHERRFRMSRPKPKRDEAAFDDWRRAQIASIDALLASCPASGLLRMREMSALAELDVLPAARFIEAGRVLAAARDIYAPPSNPAAVAKRFLEQKVGLEEVAALVEQDREEMELTHARALLFVLDDEDRQRVRVERLLRSASHLALQSELALRELRIEEAGRLLGESHAQIAAVAGAGEVRDDVQRQNVAAVRADAWRLSAELAEANEDSAAALAAYGQAIASAPPSEALRKAAAAAYLRFYGNELEFPAWIAGAERAREAALAAAAAQATGAVQASGGLPDFRWTDLSGREWTPSDLAGKAVLLNFWATWCGPCVAEMPYLTKLARRFRDDPRILILGVSVDESPGPVQPFVERLGCDYPILLGGAAVWTQWRLAAIPKNLILDPSGSIVTSEVAFSADGDRWMETMAARLLEAAGPAPTNR